MPNVELTANHAFLYVLHNSLIQDAMQIVTLNAAFAQTVLVLHNAKEIVEPIKDFADFINEDASKGADLHFQDAQDNVIMFDEQ